ncbi:hypothetical protein COBT_003292 [Conglomerata obtusa]
MGCVERVTQTIFRKLQKLSKFGISDWKKHLFDAKKAYNISFNRAIGTSPWMMKYGMLPDLKIDHIYGRLLIKTDIRNLCETRNKRFVNYAKKDIVKGKIKDKRIFKIGDKLIVRSKIRVGKISNMCKDGFYIKDILSNDSYLVTNSSNKLYRVNKENIQMND